MLTCAQVSSAHLQIVSSLDLPTYTRFPYIILQLPAAAVPFKDFKLLDLGLQIAVS